MKNFADWYIELVEDERFYENASRNHKKETVEETARKVYEVETIKPEEFAVKDIAEHRRHVLYKLYKVPADKVKKTWNEIALEEKEKKRKATDPEWIPLTGEERQKRLQEYLEVIQAAPMMKPVTPLTAREKLENQGWRPKPEAIKEPTEEEKRKALENHLKLVQQARVKLFREKYPNGTPQELQKYLKQFKHIDNPNGI